MASQGSGVAKSITHLRSFSNATNNRKHFAFSDVRKRITQDALDENFITLCEM